MHVEVSTGNNIKGSEALASQIRALVQNELANLEGHITRVEAHLSDKNAGRAGQDEIHCTLEARLRGQKPVVAKHAAETLEQATKGAAGKMKSLLESIVGRMSDRR